MSDGRDEHVAYAARMLQWSTGEPCRILEEGGGKTTFRAASDSARVTVTDRDQIADGNCPPGIPHTCETSSQSSQPLRDHRCSHEEPLIPAPLGAGTARYPCPSDLQKRRGLYIRFTEGSWFLRSAALCCPIHRLVLFGTQDEPEVEWAVSGSSSSGYVRPRSPAGCSAVAPRGHQIRCHWMCRKAEATVPPSLPGVA